VHLAEAGLHCAEVLEHGLREDHVERGGGERQAAEVAAQERGVRTGERRPVAAEVEVVVADDEPHALALPAGDLAALAAPDHQHAGRGGPPDGPPDQRHGRLDGAPVEALGAVEEREAGRRDAVQRGRVAPPEGRGPLEGQERAVDDAAQRVLAWGVRLGAEGAARPRRRGPAAQRPAGARPGRLPCS
jgi:hypothetical protein